jgi:hypothetical protein
MPHLRCATCDERLEAGYPEALTIELATHLERAHGEHVPLAVLAPAVKRAMSGDGVSSLAVARMISIVIAVFFVLVALALGPGWLAVAALAIIMVVVINAVETNAT